jgi:hypothetical protein
MAVVAQVFDNSQFFVEAGILKNNADASPDGVGFRSDVQAKDPRFAGTCGEGR